MIVPFSFATLIYDVKPPPPSEVFIVISTHAEKPLEPLPATIYVPVEEVKPIVVTPPPAPPKRPTSPNLYPVGQCTHLAKQMRPDIPNHLGNANVWYNSLKALGWEVGLTPRVGAIGQTKTGMHVVYILQVKGDQVYIAERNWDFHGSYREKWASASLYKYIY